MPNPEFASLFLDFFFKNFISGVLSQTRDLSYYETAQEITEVTNWMSFCIYNS